MAVTQRRPLADIRVIAIEQFAAGPYGSLQLADLGADVIKIEDPGEGGDIGRAVPPYATAGSSLYFETFNRGKRSLALDITNPAGRAVFEDLVKVSDAVYSNLRGDVPAKLAIRYADLQAINPRIVCCSLTGYGTTGEHAGQPGYDYILQGLAGWMMLTGEPDGAPEKTGPSLVDYSGGLVAAISLLAGVHAARRDGIGMDCDVSLFETAIALLGYPATWHLTAGYLPGRTRHSAHPSVVPFQAFEASDGWFIVGCPKEKFWQRLTEVLERPDLAADPRYRSMADRLTHRTELLETLEPLFRTRSVGEWLRDLQAAGIPSGPINDVPTALAQDRARDLIVPTHHPEFGTVRQLATAVRVGANTATATRAPALGEDRDQVLRELLRYDEARIGQLDSEGAFG